jgi:high-affinity iron transporter
MLDQMEAAAASGDYSAAESARLEAYAFMETGPEARLMIFAPQLKLDLEDLFWNGQGQHKGLASLIKTKADPAEIRSTRAQLNTALQTAQKSLGSNTAPAAMAANAGLIVVMVKNWKP